MDKNPKLQNGWSQEGPMYLTLSTGASTGTGSPAINANGYVLTTNTGTNAIGGNVFRNAEVDKESNVQILHMLFHKALEAEARK